MSGFGAFSKLLEFLGKFSFEYFEIPQNILRTFDPKKIPQESSIKIHPFQKGPKNCPIRSIIEKNPTQIRKLENYSHWPYKIYNRKKDDFREFTGCNL
jgi:hypothetical protein